MKSRIAGKSIAVRLLLGFVAIVFGQCGATAETYVGTPTDYVQILAKLSPGDTLVLMPGRYLHGLRLHHINGTQRDPIVIKGSRSAATILVARPNANTISIVNSSYVEVHDLVLDGDNRHVDAVKAESTSQWAHHITLSGLLIHRYGAHQQNVGISTQCPAWGWVIRNNVIRGAGTGMYLGGSDGRAPFIAGVIERNLIVDSIGYNLQIKHQHERPRIAGMPEDRSVTIIRHNVFSKSNNSSRDTLARPNVLVGHWPPAGPGVEDTYAIYGNFFYQNPSEALFQGEGNIAFYNNIMVNTHGDAINIQPHNAVPRRVDLFRNTVLAAKTGIRVGGGDPAYAQRMIANLVFAQTPLSGGEQHANVTGAYADAREYLAEPSGLPGRLDLAPRSGRTMVVPFEFSPQSPVPDQGLDFDGKVYLAPVAGAYASDRAAWRLVLERKP